MQQYNLEDMELVVKLMKNVALQQEKDCGKHQKIWLEKVIYIYYISVQDKQIEEVDENERGSNPNNNIPGYVDSLSKSNCSTDQILRFDCGRFVDLKLKQSTIIQNEKGLFADCNIPKGINCL